MANSQLGYYLLHMFFLKNRLSAHALKKVKLAVVLAV